MGKILLFCYRFPESVKWKHDKNEIVHTCYYLCKEKAIKHIHLIFTKRHARKTKKWSTSGIKAQKILRIWYQHRWASKMTQWVNGAAHKSVDPSLNPQNPHKGRKKEFH